MTTKKTVSRSRHPPPNVMESGVTVRPRRRRRPPQSSSTQSFEETMTLEQKHDDDDDEDIRIILQESSLINIEATSPNDSSEMSNNTAATSGTTHRRTTTNRTTTDTNTNTNPNRTYDEFVQQFRTSVQRLTSSTSTSSIWSQHPTLIQHVVTTSMTWHTTLWNRTTTTSHANDRDTSRTTTTSLLLEDHALELVSYCRTLVKDATDAVHDGVTTAGTSPTTSTSNSTSKNDDRLFVAVHGLRAALCTQTTHTENDHPSSHTSHMIDTIRRLLYFCILHIPQAITTNPTQRRFDRNLLSFLAYQAFGQTLQGYTLILENHSTTTMYQCCCVRRTGPRSSGILRFPIPQPRPSQKENAMMNPSPRKKRNDHGPNMTALDQICIMCIVASWTVARRMVAHLQTTASSSHNHDDNDADDDPKARTQNDISRPYMRTTGMEEDGHRSDFDLVAEIRHLMFGVAIPWVRTFAVVVLGKNNSNSHICSSSMTSRKKCTAEPVKGQSASTANHEQMMVSYCKKVQRLLYDLAEINIHNPTTKLLLQADSIRAFLLDISDPMSMSDADDENHPDHHHLQQQQEQQSSDMLIRTILRQQNIYDQACTYAWKISDSYYSTTNAAQTSSSTGSTTNISTPLDTFHQQIGSVLDSFTEGPTSQNSSIDDTYGVDDVETRVKTNTTAISMTAYVEYCAYRSFHITRHRIPDRGCTNRENCLFHLLPYQYGHFHQHQLPSYNENEAFLMVFFLSRYVRYCLEHEADSSELYEIFSQIPTKEIIQEFRSHCLSTGINVVDSVTKLRWYNLFSMVGLHRVVHRMLDRLPKSDQSLQYMEVARLVLSECMVPFCLNLLPDDNNVRQRTHLWSYIISCYRFSLCMYERSQSKDLANETVNELSRILLKHKPPPSWDVIESTAKFFYGIGKKRYDSEQTVHALYPLLHSIKLLTYGTSFVSPTLIPSLKLSGRLTYVATIYKSLDLNDESIIATMLALVFDSIEVSITCPSTTQSSDLISWLAIFTENIVVLTSDNSTQNQRSEQRLGLQNSLLQLLLKKGRSPMVSYTGITGSTKTGTLNSSAFVDILLESLDKSKHESCSKSFESHCHVPFNLSTILSSLIANKVIPRHRELDKSSVVMEFLKLSTELLVRFGHLLQRSKRDVTDDTAASLNDYLNMCQFTESMISKLTVDDNVQSPLALAMMYLVASISLVSAQPAFKFEGWMTESFSKKGQRGSIAYFDMAKKLADRGYSILSESNVSDQLSFATLTTIELYRYQLSQLQCGELHYGINFNRLQEFYDKANAMESLTGSSDLNWQLCLTTTLSRLCMLLYLEGEGLRALQIAKWNCTSTLGVDREAKAWSETILLTLIAESSIISIRRTNTESLSNPVNFEVTACKLRLQARDGECSTSYIETQLQNLLDAICDRTTKFGSDFDDVVNWSLTTVYLGLSECAERQGCLESSMMFLKKCFEVCRTIISTIKRIKPANDRCTTAWHNKMLTYISLTCLKRQVKCMYRTALLYHRIGNYRKSIEYSFASLHSPLLEEAGLTSKSAFAHAVSLTRQFPARNSNERLVRRLYLRLKSLSCSLDSVTDQFRVRDDHLCLSRVDEACKGTEHCVNYELEDIVDMYEIVNMVNGYQLSESRFKETTLHQLATRKFVQYSLSEDVAKLLRTVLSFAKSSDEPFLQLQYNAKLRDAAGILSNTATESNESYFTILTWLKDICSSQSCSTICRAWSYYLLGLMSLKSSRKRADGLRKSSPATSSEMAHLADARIYFTDGLQILGTSCDLLTRNMQRCLAATIESGSMSESDALRCFSLINDSVGGSINSQVLRQLLPIDDVGDQDELKGNVDSSLGDSNAMAPFLQQLGHIAPAEWRFITAAISPTGELLLSSLEFSALKMATFFNATIGADAFTQSDSSRTTDMFDIIVKPLNDIVARSQQQLAGTGVNDCEDDTAKEKATRHWWQIRKQIDSDLQQHLDSVESVLLASDTVQRVLLGRPLSILLNDSANESDDLPCGNLADRFEEASNEDGIHPHQQRQRTPNRSVRRTTDQVLARSLFDDEMDNVRVEPNDSPYITPKPCSRQECIFLILDENLVSFPFEGLSCFEGKAVCRLPSLTFALAKLTEFGLDRNDNLTFDPRKTSYILDPESNLSGTQERLTPFLDSIQTDHDYQWDKIVGEIPPIDFMETSLLVDDGLLLYFGHGGGQQFCGRGKLEALARHGQRALSSVILMGCGSGRLESINTKNSKSTSKLPIHYEPEGVALSYLLAGSPCVVGNLWDVTDRDIDRYSVQLLQSIYDNSNGDTSIAQCVADARQVCKMRYIVGCAPVCYGFPIFAREK